MYKIYANVHLVGWYFTNKNPEDLSKKHIFNKDLPLNKRGRKHDSKIVSYSMKYGTKKLVVNKETDTKRISYMMRHRSKGVA